MGEGGRPEGTQVHLKTTVKCK